MKKKTELKEDIFLKTIKRIWQWLKKNPTKIRNYSIVFVLSVVVFVIIWICIEKASKKAQYEFINLKTKIQNALLNPKILELKGLKTQLGEFLNTHRWHKEKNIGYFYLALINEKLKDYKKAERFYKELLKKTKGMFWVVCANNLGVLYENQKKYEEALEIYQMIFKKHGKSGFGAYALLAQARCLEQLKKFKEAKEKYNELKLYYPSSAFLEFYYH